MANPRALSMVVLAMCAGLTGCFVRTRTVQRTLAPEMYRSASVQNLEKEVSDRDHAIQTLDAAVLITASTGGGKEGKVNTYTSFRGYIFVRKPRELRVILQLPVIGSRALDMVSNGQTFKLLMATSHGRRAIEGSNQVTTKSKNGLENLRPAVFFDSLLVPGVAQNEFVTLTESTRILEPQGKHHDALEEPDYDLTVLKPDSGNVLQRERVVQISRVTMLPFQQDIYDENGQVVTKASYDKYQTFDGHPFPMLITITRPLDEYSLKIDVTKLTLNQAFDNDQFELKIPAGVPVQNLP